MFFIELSEVGYENISDPCKKVQPGVLSFLTE